MLKTKRILFGLIAVSVMLCLLTACGSGQSSNGTTNGTNSVPNYYESQSDDYDAQTDDYDFQQSDVDPVQALLSESLMYPSQNSEWKYEVYQTYVKITGYLGGSVQELVLPETIENLPVKVYDGTLTPSKLTISSIRFPNTLIVLGGDKYTGLSQIEGLKSVILPEGLIEIGEDMFRYCDQLTDVKLPSTLKRIGASAFDGCNSMKNVTIPASVEEIGSMAFFRNGRANYLESVTVLNPNTILEKSDLECCNTMYGYEGSTAAALAAKSGVTFKVIE